MEVFIDCTNCQYYSCTSSNADLGTSVLVRENIKIEFFSWNSCTSFFASIYERISIFHVYTNSPLEVAEQLWKYQSRALMEKKMMVCYERTLGQSGPVLQRPVILPPLKAGSVRCSVKPASRGACHFRDKEANAFALAPQQPTSQLGTGKPACYDQRKK